MQKMKHTTLGYEKEYHIVDSSGKPAIVSDEMVKKCESDGYLIEKEVASTQVEIIGKPERDFERFRASYLRNSLSLISKMRESGAKPVPFSVLPNEYKPKIKKGIWYKAIKQIFGARSLEKGARVCGTHFHYSLPFGIMSRKTSTLNTITMKKFRKRFINQYNMLIALDPSAITFTQSSPIYRLKTGVKDFRVLLYRDKEYKNIIGRFLEFPDFGGLPHYEFTIEDIRVRTKNRKDRYISMLRERGFSELKEIYSVNELKFIWGPLRVSKHGTFEYRGMDTTLPSIQLSTICFVYAILSIIEEQGLKVIPEDEAIKNPFKVEGDVVLIPPMSTVRSTEYLSAVYGLDNSYVQRYCKNALKLAGMKKGYKREIGMLKEIVDEKGTFSDEIISVCKKNGFSEHITREFAEYLNLYAYERFKEDLESEIADVG